MYFGEIPLMTNRGTFIINGVEKIVISQLTRSSGVYFTSVNFKGQKLFGARIIPYHGAWLEFETDTAGVISTKLIGKEKLPLLLY